ncbi:MAG: hypothetical protein R6W90_11035 [Ignavibacteriaceae bacterium]
MTNRQGKDRLESLLAIYKKDPGDSFIKYGIALEYLSRKDNLKAEEFFQMILKDDPSYIPAYMQYGIYHSNQNNIDKAKDLFKKGIEIAKKAGDKHAAKEMEDFLDELD